MGKIIPYFYTDLIARMVPGTVLIALVSITTLPVPKQWVAIFERLGSAQGVMVPILFAGLAYVSGTVLASLLSYLLEWCHIVPFKCALKKHTTRYKRTSGDSEKPRREAKELLREAFGYLITSDLDDEKQAIPHLLRYHSEGKMCFSSMIILSAFLVLAIVDNSSYQLIRDVGIDYTWLLTILFLTILSLLYTTYEKLRDRVTFMVKTIERSVATDGSRRTAKGIRDELLSFRNYLNSTNKSSKHIP